MRTNIEIDDELMREAMKATNATTKKAAVEACLRRTVQLKKQESIRELFGKVQWDGDLDALRQSRISEWEAAREHIDVESTEGNSNNKHETTASR